MKLGIIGVGGFAQHAILPGFEQSKDFEIAMVCDREPERLRAVAERYGADATTDVDTLLARRDLDLVVVATRPAAHRELAGRVIEAGHNLLCEKPVSLGAKESGELAELAAKKGIVNAVDHELRYSGEMSAIRALLPRIGRTRFVAISMIFGYGMTPASTVYYWSYTARRDLGGGLMPQLLSHPLDIISQCFDGFDRVSGQLALLEPMRPIFDEESLFERLEHRPPPPDGTERRLVECEDTVALNGILGNGAFFSLTSSWSVHGAPGTRWEIYGDEGTIRYESDDFLRGGKIRLFGPGQMEGEEVAIPDCKTPYIGFGHDLAVAISGKGEMNGGFATLSDEHRIWTIIEALRQNGHYVMPDAQR